MRRVKTFVKPMESHWLHKFSLDVSSLIAITSAFVKQKRSKMRHLKKFVKTKGDKLRSKMSHWPKIHPLISKSGGTFIFWDIYELPLQTTALIVAVTNSVQHKRNHCLACKLVSFHHSIADKNKNTSCFFFKKYKNN